MGATANQRGEVMTVFLIAFVITVLVLAIGISVDQTVHAPCNPQTTQCIDYGSGMVEAPK